MNRGREPLIGITCEAVSKKEDFSDYHLYCDHRYAAAIKNAGGHPVLLPIAHKKSVLHRYLDGIDGLVIVGGDDVDPRLYGEKPLETTKIIFKKRTEFDTWLYKTGKKRHLPILGICYGMQLVNVLEGGTLYQVIPRKDGHNIHHDGKEHSHHRVHIHTGTHLSRILKTRNISVNTEHHQAVNDLANGFIVSATAEDGLIESIENHKYPQLITVQWHPERQLESRVTQKLFKYFVKMCVAYKRKHRK